LNLLLNWYKTKDNVKTLDLYSASGSSGNLYFKHLAIVFKYYVNLLKIERVSNKEIGQAYTDLNSLTNEMLSVIT